jgi:hypothetical protein
MAMATVFDVAAYILEKRGTMTAICPSFHPFKWFQRMLKRFGSLNSTIPRARQAYRIAARYAARVAGS